MYGYIYLTTNLINNKRYIGKKTSPTFLGESYLGSGTIIERAIKKHKKEYGKLHFKVELVEACNSKNELNAREDYWITFYNAVDDDNYYNIAKGGQGGNTLAGYSEAEKQEFRAKISKTHEGSSRWKGKNNPNYGNHNPISKEQRQKMIATHKTVKHNHFAGKTHSEESRKKTSETLKAKGVGKSNLGLRAINNGIISKRIRPEAFEEYSIFGFIWGDLPKKKVSI